MRERKKKESKKEREKENKTEIFIGNFLHSEKDKWNFGGIFYLTLYKCYNLQVFCITLLPLS